MDLTKLEARLKSDDLLERNLAITAAIKELSSCYAALAEMSAAILNAFGDHGDDNADQ